MDTDPQKPSGGEADSIMSWTTLPVAAVVEQSVLNVALSATNAAFVKGQLIIIIIIIINNNNNKRMSIPP